MTKKPIGTMLPTVLMLLATLAAAGQEPGSKPQPNQKATPRTSQLPSEQGQQVFQRNCSRCHKAPEAVPPSISGTVTLHMRIRAGLSEKDYKRLLAFLNP